MDYANIWGMLWLRKFTVCFWMKSSCNNYGTPFSYAVPGQANELLVYNYKDFHLYIGGTARLVVLFFNARVANSVVLSFGAKFQH